jgi:hypothetical protein
MSTLSSACASCDSKVQGFASTHLPEIGDRYSLSFGDAEVALARLCRKATDQKDMFPKDTFPSVTAALLLVNESF